MKICNIIRFSRENRLISSLSVAQKFEGHFHYISNQKITHTIQGGCKNEIMVRNEIGNPCSNPGRDILLHAYALGKNVNPSVLHPALGKW